MEFPKHFLSKLKTANRIVFFTGAGISAESGIATFRGKDGLWNKLKPEELASFDAFLRNPDLVWEWYQHRRQILHESKPNRAHEAIAQFEKYFEDVTVVTQNIDNLHRRAGSNRIYELHGNIERNYCIDCRKDYDMSEFNLNQKQVPKCDECGGLIRPDVVWFGEYLPQRQFSASEGAAEKCDICFVVGTSGVVYPAAYIPITARNGGAMLVEINVEETDMTRLADFSFFGKAGETLPSLLKMIREL